MNRLLILTEPQARLARSSIRRSAEMAYDIARHADDHALRGVAETHAERLTEVATLVAGCEREPVAWVVILCAVTHDTPVLVTLNEYAAAREAEKLVGLIRDWEGPHGDGCATLAEQAEAIEAFAQAVGGVYATEVRKAGWTPLNVQVVAIDIDGGTAHSRRILS